MLHFVYHKLIRAKKTLWITSLSWRRSLCNSVKLWAIPCSTTQDGRVIVGSADKTWSAGGGNGKPPQYTCCENLMNCIKGQKDMTPKDKSRRSEGVQYATGEEWRRITNSPRMNEAAGPKWIWCSVVAVSGDQSKIWWYKKQDCIGTRMLGPWIKEKTWSSRKW